MYVDIYIHSTYIFSISKASRAKIKEYIAVFDLKYVFCIFCDQIKFDREPKGFFLLR